MLITPARMPLLWYCEQYTIVVAAALLSNTVNQPDIRESEARASYNYNNRKIEYDYFENKIKISETATVLPSKSTQVSGPVTD